MEYATISKNIDPPAKYATVDKKKTRVAVNESEFDEYQRYTTALTFVINQNKQVFDELASEISEHCGLIAVLNGVIEHMIPVDEHKKLQADHDKLRERYNAVGDRIADKDRTIKQLQAQIKDMTKRAASDQSTIRGLERDKTRLQVKNEMLTDMYEPLRSSVVVQDIPVPPYDG